MLLANYNSDSEAGTDSEPETSSGAGPSRASRAAPPPPPPRAAQAPVVGSSTKAPAPVAGKPKRKGPVKITLDLPKGGKGDDADGNGSGEEGDRDDGEPEAKKPKLGLGGKGKGTSALLGMLPPPKRKTPGSNGSTSKPGSGPGLAVNRSMARPARPPPPVGEADLSGIIGPGAANGDEDDEGEDGKGGMLLPASVARGKAKAKAEPAMDLFGLSEPSAPIPSTSKLSTPKPPQISSAPAAPDFIPPPPTPQDPYPGYYQTPSGDWKAYDPAYYASFFSEAAELQGDKADDGRVGHHWDEYDTKGAHVQDVDVSSSLKAAREEEERKNMTKKPKMPADEFEYKARCADAVIGQTKGLAAQRHQLTSLLHTAYTGREELEERIAQNKKNMRLAGQKYGF